MEENANTIVKREHTGFWISTELMERIRSRASKEKISVDRYVEQVLFDSEYYEPNETTLAAMREVAERGKDLEEFDLEELRARLSKAM